MILLIFLAALIGSILIGLPICFALLFSGVCMMFGLNGFNSMILSMNLFSGADSFSMMAVPFFVLAGEFMNRGGITKRIVNFANSLVGHVRGGLGYVSIIAILLFASMVGSAVASTAALGAILIPMMVKAGYNRDRSTGLIAAGNILSPIMPPSVPMIIFGVQAGVSVTKLFMGGIAPAVYMSLALCVIWFFVAKRDNLPTAPRQTKRQILHSIRDGLWALLLPLFILVGLRSGKFTATEAGVICVVYAMIVGMFVYRELKPRDVLDCLISAAKSSSVIMFLAAAAMVSSWVMTVANIPAIVTNILTPFIAHPTVLMLVICLLVLLALPLRYLAQSSSLSDRVFRHPLAGAAVTFILMWSMIFLPSYTMGGIGAGRLLNVVWMTFILGLAVTEFLLFGWLERILGVCLTPAIRQLEKAGKCLPLVCAAMLVCMACIGSHTVKEGQDNHFATTLEAAYELADGEAARFAKVLDEREAVLTDTDQPDVVIRPLTEEERPWLLFYTDVAPGPDLWGLTPYYSKNSVTIADYNN